MKSLTVALGILAAIGAGLLFVYLMGDRLPDKQAGYAWVENEDGERVISTGERPNGRTIVPENIDDGSDEPWLKKFVLTERSGELLGSEDLEGQPYIAGFFFSTCPSICVKQNSKVQALQEEFKGQAVRFLSISCDPEVDTPEVLSDYADRFNADKDQWLFLTGKMNYIRRVGAEYFSLGVTPRGHPEKFALMDAKGEMYGLYTWSDEGQWETLQQDIAKMIAAGGVLKKPDSEQKPVPDTEETEDADSAGDSEASLETEDQADSSEEPTTEADE